jgi:hypothetical protein
MEERRRSQRYPLELHALCLVQPGAEGFHVMVTEISPEGMALQCVAGIGLAVNQPCILEVDIPGKLEPVRVEMITRQLHALCGQGEYRYAAGGELTAISPEDCRMLLDYGAENRQRYEEQHTLP